MKSFKLIALLALAFGLTQIQANNWFGEKAKTNQIADLAETRQDAQLQTLDAQDELAYGQEDLANIQDEETTSELETAPTENNDTDSAEDIL